MSADMVEGIVRLRVIGEIANARLQHPAERDDNYGTGEWLDDIEDKVADAYADSAVRRAHLIEVAALALAAVEGIDLRNAVDGA
jgi:hypothetical protein